MTVTAKMIAKELGISESAVSIALNNKKGVSRETRRIIIDTAHITVDCQLTKHVFPSRSQVCSVPLLRLGHEEHTAPQDM